MELTIKGTIEEITDLIAEVQKQQITELLLGPFIQGKDQKSSTQFDPEFFIDVPQNC